MSAGSEMGANLPPAVLAARIALRQRDLDRLKFVNRYGRPVRIFHHPIFLSRLFLDAAPTRDVALMLGEGVRKNMAARTVRNEVECRRLIRLQNSLDSGAAGIGDWRWWKPIVSIGIVGVLPVFKLAAQNGMTKASLASARAVNDGGIGIEVHPLFQPVEIHGGNARTLIGAAGLLFHDGSQIDDIVRLGERKVARPGRPDPSTNFFCSPCIRWISSSREVPRAKR